MDYEVFGRVVEAKSGRGVPGVVVSAYDKDPVFDDFLGEALSTVTGDFRIVYDESRFKSVFDRKPDIYVKAKTLAGQELLDAKGATRFDAGPREEVKVVLDADLLTKAGLAATDGDPRQPISRAALTTLTCLADVPGGDDDLVKQIRNDLSRAPPRCSRCSATG